MTDTVLHKRLKILERRAAIYTLTTFAESGITTMMEQKTGKVILTDLTCVLDTSYHTAHCSMDTLIKKKEILNSKHYLLVI